MSKSLALLLLASFLFVPAIAQTVKAPTPVLSHGGDASFQGTPNWGSLPAGSAHLIFYGGDTNTTDPNEEGFANGNTVLVPNTTTYGAVIVPANTNIVATGVLFNQFPDQSGNVFDPAIATYDVRIDLSSANGGTSVTSGSGKQYAVLTGRKPFGASEYATSVAFTAPFIPTPGVTYWVNESPQCTDSSNSNCTILQYFVDNTTQRSNAINGFAQPQGQMFLNSAFFGFTWTNWCDPSLGQNSQQCAYLSFGLYGH